MDQQQKRAWLRPFIITGIWAILIVAVFIAVAGMRASGRHKHDLTRELFIAVAHRDVAAVDDLLKRGADPNSLQDGAERTPLIDAIEIGDTAIVKVMLRRGADPNAEGAYGDTPLAVATRTGNQTIVRLLLAHGAKPDSANSR